MAGIVGSKGQIVISKKIRDQLGIEPGWRVSQRLVDGHLEIYFIQPEHNRSLKGSLQRFIDPSLAEGLDWEEIRARAWTRAAKEREDKSRA